MGSSTFGRLFTFTTFGESHGEALGAVVEGMPSGFPLSEEVIQPYLDRRRPGGNALGTKRDEKDRVKILSGVYKGLTTGTPICMIVFNEDQRSTDYSEIENIYRPGHADLTYQKKYGIRDPRGGGRSSGRETVSRVMAGALAMEYLKTIGVSFSSAVVGVGRVRLNGYSWNPPFDPPLFSPDSSMTPLMLEEIESARREGDSIGSVVECHISGVPSSLGDPVFYKLDALISMAVMSLGGVKAIEFGSGIKASSLKGSENNDQMDSSGFKSNNAGGILGGISTGEDIIFTCYFKPTPSISKTQQTLDTSGNERTIQIKGRHDPIIAPRALVAVESMAACVIMDEYLINRAYSKD